MKLISIYRNGIEIDYIQETLSLKQDFELFPESFKFTVSEYPFLIIENENAVQAFGLNTILDTSSQYYTVDIISEDVRVTGELQILECFPGYRKCTLRFSSRLYSISNIKIRDLMPTFSTTGSVDIPYSDKFVGLPPPGYLYEHFVRRFALGIFPERFWRPITMIYPDKFGEQSEEDTWFNYAKSINALDNSLEYIVNEYETTSNGIIIHSKNVPSWNVFLLTPLQLICDKIGLSFPKKLLDDKFARSIAFYSNENNLTEVTEIGDRNEIPYLYGNWSVLNMSDKYLNYTKTIKVKFSKIGQYTFRYKLKAFDNRMLMGLRTPTQDFKKLFFTSFLERHETLEGEHVFTITQEDLQKGGEMMINIQAFKNIDPYEIIDFYYSTNVTQKGFLFHPTIEMGRYIPDWTVGDYIQQIVRLFNLQFTENEMLQSLDVSYNDELIDDYNYVDLGSIYNESYTKIDYNRIKMKNANDTDPIYIKKTDTAEDTNITSIDDKTKLLEFKFKNTPQTITKEFEDREGIGLILIGYEESIPIQNVGATTLKVEDIYNRYCAKSAIKFLNPNRIIIEHSVTNFKLTEILQKRKVLINKLPYWVDNISKESTGDLIDIKMSLLPL